MSLAAWPPLARRLKRSCREERGAVLILTAISMVVIIGMAGMAIDVGGWYQNERQAQGAADAAALAGSADLPGNPTTAVADAQSYMAKNLPGATAVVTTPYNSSASQIQVTVSDTAPSSFARLFGLSSVNVSASAVAGAIAASTPTAIVAYNATGCSASINLEGNNESITGGIAGSGNLTVGANPPSTFGATTYGPGCAYSPGSGTFSSGPKPGAIAGFPLDYRSSTSPCPALPWPASYTWSSNGTIAAGVYCTTGTITLSAKLSSAAGGVTFVANSFVITGNSMDLKAPTTGPGAGLLFWQTGSGTFTMNGNSASLTGNIFAPTALLDFEGNSSGTGMIEGSSVKIGGNGFQITGTGPPIGGGSGTTALLH